MMQERVETEGAEDALRIGLDEGHAERMGGGMFVLFQEVDGRVQSITVSQDDLTKLLAAA
jgi:hypothetical protein